MEVSAHSRQRMVAHAIQPLKTEPCQPIQFASVHKRYFKTYSVEVSRRARGKRVEFQPGCE